MKLPFLALCLFSYLTAVGGSVVVKISPAQAVSAGAQWQVDGGAWQNSGTTLTVQNGSRTISYKSVNGWSAPSSVVVNVKNGKALNVLGTYSATAALTVSLTPSTAQWRVDNGTWQNSGATVSNLNAGSHSIAYSALSGYTAPTSENVTLTAGVTTSLSRSYTQLPAALTVSLVPSSAQWRVDNGTWQNSGATVSNLNAGSHSIAYSALSGYTAPTSENVTLTAGVTTSLSRSYTLLQSGQLRINAYPSSAARVSAVSWRVNGGEWQNADTTVSVAVGNHTVEFQPKSGWITPDTISTQVQNNQTTTLNVNYHPVHRLRFFLNENLTTGLAQEQIRSRISQYVAHLQLIFHRETARRFTFDPQTDITLCTASPYSNSGGVLPEVGFEVWAYAALTDKPDVGSYDGSSAIDASGAAGADNLKWDKIYDPSSLGADASALAQYWIQLDHIIHELEHVFGAGVGEYYTAKFLSDPTDVAPILPDTFYQNPDPTDIFWGTRSEYWTDPLTRNIYGFWRLGSPTTLEDLLEITAFAPATQGVINDLRRGDLINSLPDMSRVKVRVVDAATNQLIPSATVRVWNRKNPGANNVFEHTVSNGANQGEFEFSWNPYPNTSIFGSVDNIKIIKAWAPGYNAAAQWEWIYDAQKAKTIDGSSFFVITLRLSAQ